MIWIKTQENRLKECCEICQPIKEKEEFVIYGFCDSQDYGQKLAKYKTEERALEVIEEIWKVIQPRYFFKENGLVETVQNVGCYVMPKE